MIKLIIAGGRNFNDYNLLKLEVDAYLDGYDNVEIISGKAKGADSLGEYYAIKNNIKVIEFPAQWDEFGKSAGYRRNVEMAEYGNTLIAFWDGKSRGTKHMIDIAEKKGLFVKVVKY